MISIVAYRAAYEQFDASLASAIAMIMGAVQLVVVGLGARLGGLAAARLQERRQMTATVARRRIVASPLAWLAWGFVGFFLVFVAALVAAVVVNSLERAGWTTGCPTPSRRTGTATRGASSGCCRV